MKGENIMSTTFRPEVSKKNPYYIPRERFYELKHFCRQYPTWKKSYEALDGLSKRPEDLEVFARSHQTSDPTALCAEKRERFRTKMDMVEQSAREASPELYQYVMKYATKGDAYSVLKMRDNIPCGKDMFYDVVRKFFWLLSDKRG